ncbi:MAG: hypothetical protein AB7F89_18835, partial [Pirellulaceae bacterium]
MSAPFDPYDRWLGIPPEEQPADYYRLLGVNRFESDVQRIQAAADQRMAHVRAFQTGPRGRFTQPLLNELAAAKVRLLNPVSKRQYDAALADAVSLHHTEFSPDLLPPAVEQAPAAVRPPSESANAGFPIPVLELRVAISDVPRRRSWDPYLLGFWLPWGGAILALVAGVAWTIGQTLRRPDESMPAAIAPPIAEAPIAKAPSDGTTPLRPAPIVVYQEASGDVHLSASVAQLVPPTVSGDGTAERPSARQWTFKLSQLPSHGAFRVVVRYDVGATAVGALYILRIGRDARQRDFPASPRARSG